MGINKNWWNDPKNVPLMPLTGTWWQGIIITRFITYRGFNLKVISHQLPKEALKIYQILKKLRKVWRMVKNMCLVPNFSCAVTFAWHLFVCSLLLGRATSLLCIASICICMCVNCFLASDWSRHFFWKKVQFLDKNNLFAWLSGFSEFSPVQIWP